MATPAPYPRCEKHDMLMQRGVGGYSKSYACKKCMEEKMAKKKQEAAAPGIGHNSGATNVSGARLKSFLERIERLEEEKKVLGEDIRDIYSEAKSTGFEPKILKKIVALRKVSLDKRREENEILSLYLSSMGMAADLEVFG